MPEMNICPECGGLLPAGGPPNLCVGCLLILAGATTDKQELLQSELPSDPSEGAALESFGDYELIEELEPVRAFELEAEARFTRPLLDHEEPARFVGG